MKIYRAIILASCASTLSACASLGTNVSGSFDCKAPSGSCAPTAVIDEQASEALLDAEKQNGRRRSIAAAQTARTGEQLLKIIFPGFVDTHGNLHEARTVHVVAQRPDWTAALAGDDSVKAIARRIGRASRKPAKTPETNYPNIADHLGGTIVPFDHNSDHEAFDLNSFSLPTRAVNPLTVREAIAGLKQPAIEGFDMFPPWHERTPHPSSNPSTGPTTNPTNKQTGLPTVEAIEAAKKRASEEKSR
ncbi:MAG: hypothetical protein GW808_07680 [Sphingomonadales bacterium]|nr:hypothetical protein [Sphingomonadales bacterium]NCO50157.1 hypothetical protein [Sphingomonadales bacterium]NCP01043.1 hypothetical protein [Sphingomonadales bacterium]NCP26370.1 hypothetical protein [Sphingomonadales bacterium]NCP43532.1 hypothetical protein [Sphingomonadales bacterium]